MHLEAKYGYDKPLVVQYGLYLSNVIRGDFGPSLHYKGRTVNEIIAAGAPYSFTLGLIAIVLAYTVGIGLSLLCVTWKDSPLDYGLLFIALIGICVPSFLSAKVALFLLGYKLKLVPTAADEIGLAALILPAVILSLPFIAYITRLGRKSFADELNKDYVRTAQAAGIPHYRILFLQVLKNGFLPLLTFLGPAAAGLLTGSVVIEKVFALPGIGSDFVQGALNRDHFLVLGVVMIYSGLLLSFNFIVDIMYHVVDPRIKAEGEGS